MDKVKQVGISNSEDGPIYSIEDANSLENKPEIEAKAWVEGQHRPEEDSIQCSHACKRWDRIEMKSNHMKAVLLIYSSTLLRYKRQSTLVIKNNKFLFKILCQVS